MQKIPEVGHSLQPLSSPHPSHCQPTLPPGVMNIAHWPKDETLLGDKYRFLHKENKKQQCSPLCSGLSPSCCQPHSLPKRSCRGGRARRTEKPGSSYHLDLINESRLGICQNIYTTQFSGERILHTENA